MRRRIAFAASALLWFGCGASANRASTMAVSYRHGCPEADYWNGSKCIARGDGASKLEAGQAALAAFRVDEALPLLEDARDNGPHRHSVIVGIYEQLGIALAYLGREKAALEAFDMLLALEPGHLLSYTLSPKATFLFERARKAAQVADPPTVQVSWPRDLDVSGSVPVDIEVVADPKAFLKRAALHVRTKGASTFESVDVTLPAPGSYQRVTLPPVAANKPAVLQLYLTALDDRGNEVLRWANEQRPREIPLGYSAPVRWYRKWWVWAVAGGVVTAATGTTVYLIGRDPPDTVGGDLGIGR